MVLPLEVTMLSISSSVTDVSLASVSDCLLEADLSMVEALSALYTWLCCAVTVVLEVCVMSVLTLRVLHAALIMIHTISSVSTFVLIDRRVNSYSRLITGNRRGRFFLGKGSVRA